MKHCIEYKLVKCVSKDLIGAINYRPFYIYLIRSDCVVNVCRKCIPKQKKRRQTQKSNRKAFSKENEEEEEEG